MKPLEGEESATVWRYLRPSLSRGVRADGDRPRAQGRPRGRLRPQRGARVATSGSSPTARSRSSRSRRARPRSSRCRRSVPRRPRLRGALGRPELASGSADKFEIDLAGDRHVGIEVPLKTATGETVGAVLALRSKNAEMAGFHRFRNSLVMVSAGVMVARPPLRVPRARPASPGPCAAWPTSSSAPATAPTRARSTWTAETRSERWRARSTACWPTCARRSSSIDFLPRGQTMQKKSGGGDAGGDGHELDLGGDGRPHAVSPGVAMRRGDLFASRYELLSTLGKGGMGVVYLARDQQLDEEVALKVLRPDVLKDDPTILDRFKQEIKLARRITHGTSCAPTISGRPTAPPTSRWSTSRGSPSRTSSSSKGALPIGVGLRIAKQMCQGLEAAHLQGVVHRDIKPQNMLILPGDGRAEDHGLRDRARLGGEGGHGARRLRPHHGGHGDGNARLHVPRSRRRARPADYRSDIYSLAVVLYEVFTGRLPFTADTIMKVVLAHIRNPAAAAAHGERPHPAGAGSGDPARTAEGTGGALPDGRARWRATSTKCRRDTRRPRLR